MWRDDCSQWYFIAVLLRIGKVPLLLADVRFVTWNFISHCSKTKKAVRNASSLNK